LVKGEVFEFKLGRLPDETEAFFVTKNGIAFEPDKNNQRLYQLVRHRAAEIIGGVRAGHAEYNARQRRKRAKQRVGR
jgi:hypothetical protein